MLKNSIQVENRGWNSVPHVKSSIKMPLNRSQQLPALYKLLIDEIKQN